MLFFVGERSSELLEDNSSSAGVSMLSKMIGSCPLLRSMGCFAWLLSYASFSPRSCFFQHGPANNGFPAIDVRHNSAIPSSVLLVLPVSLCLNTNKEIGLRATG